MLRFDAAARAGLRSSGEAPSVGVDPGQALMLWLHSVGAAEDAARFWSQPSFPDARAVSARDAAGAPAGDAPARFG